jgi:hypothetical protein
LEGIMAGDLIWHGMVRRGLVRRGLWRRGFGSFLAVVGAYPICTAVHLQNILSGTVMFVAGVALYIWGSER